MAFVGEFWTMLGSLWLLQMGGVGPQCLVWWLQKGEVQTFTVNSKICKGDCKVVEWLVQLGHLKTYFYLKCCCLENSLTYFYLNSMRAFLSLIQGPAIRIILGLGKGSQLAIWETSHHHHHAQCSRYALSPYHSCAWLGMEEDREPSKDWLLLLFLCYCPIVLSGFVVAMGIFREYLRGS